MPKDILMLQKVLPVIFIQDWSKSFSSADRAVTMNETMRAMINGWSEAEDEMEDVRLSLAYLMASNSAEWKWSGLLFVKDVVWEDVTPKQTGFNLTASLSELSKALTYDSLLKNKSQFFRPIIIWCVAAGESTDSRYEEVLEQLEQNPWYRNAIKVAIAVGHEVDYEMLLKLTKTGEGILKSNDIEMLRDFIRPIEMPDDWIVEEREKTKPFVKVDPLSGEIRYRIKTSTQQFDVSEGEELLLKNCQLRPCGVSEALWDAFLIKQTKGNLFVKQLIEEPIAAQDEYDFHGDRVYKILKAHTEHRLNVNQIGDFNISEQDEWGSLTDIEFHVDGKDLIISPRQDAILTRNLEYDKDIILFDGDCVKSSRYGTLFSVMEVQTIEDSPFMGGVIIEDPDDGWN